MNKREKMVMAKRLVANTARLADPPHEELTAYALVFDLSRALAYTLEIIDEQDRALQRLYDERI